ncbi:MAG: hypothetical protein J6U92_04755 [Clostridia bacterium]|nr:hypothetical protein [Clostridia bacterium]
MAGCNNCKNSITSGNVLACPNCGKTFCSDCANKTKRICPHCYHDLEYIG